jgi:hypothetical protein
VFTFLRTDGAAVVGRERIAPVQLAAGTRVEAANDNVTAFDREVIRINTGGKLVDRDTGQTLQCFRDALVREGADILGGDGVLNDIRVLLEPLRVFQTLPQTGDDDFLDRLVPRRRGCVRGIDRAAPGERSQRQAGKAGAGAGTVHYREINSFRNVADRV